MLDDEFGAQLTGCSTQTEGASGCTVDQSPPLKVGVGEGGRVGEAVLNPVLHQGVATFSVVDAAVVNFEVGQVSGEGAT